MINFKYFAQNRKAALSSLVLITAVIAYFPISNYIGEVYESKSTQKKLQSLVEKEILYLDENQIKGASTGSKVYAVFKTSEGDYALIPIVKAKISVFFPFPNLSFFLSAPQ